MRDVSVYNQPKGNIKKSQLKMKEEDCCKDEMIEKLIDQEETVIIRAGALNGGEK